MIDTVPFLPLSLSKILKKNGSSIQNADEIKKKNNIQNLNQFYNRIYLSMWNGVFSLPKV